MDILIQNYRINMKKSNSRKKTARVGARIKSGPWASILSTISNRLSAPTLYDRFISLSHYSKPWTILGRQN